MVYGVFCLVCLCIAVERRREPLVVIRRATQQRYYALELHNIKRSNGFYDKSQFRVSIYSIVSNLNMNTECKTPTKTPVKRTTENSATPNKKARINLCQSSLEFFTFLDTRSKDGLEKVYYTCNLCKKETNGTKLSNLSSHLSHHHPELVGKIRQPNGSIDEKRLKLLLECVESVSVNARPFAHLNDSSLHSMLDDKLSELESAGRKLNLKDPHLNEVKDCLVRISENCRDKIKHEIKNRPLSLLADIVTKRGRSILGFSLQYIFNGKLRVRSIGMVHLDASHTGIHLAELIVERLKEYDVGLYQIVAIATDNGSNMLKMVKDIRKIESNHTVSEKVNNAVFNTT